MFRAKTKHTVLAIAIFLAVSPIYGMLAGLSGEAGRPGGDALAAARPCGPGRAAGLGPGPLRLALSAERERQAARRAIGAYFDWRRDNVDSFLDRLYGHGAERFRATAREPGALAGEAPARGPGRGLPGESFLADLERLSGKVLGLAGEALQAGEGLGPCAASLEALGRELRALAREPGRILPPGALSPGQGLAAGGIFPGPGPGRPVSRDLLREEILSALEDAREMALASASP
jgi:hypothetical protein